MKKSITIIFAYRNRDLHRIKISMDSLGEQTNKHFQVIFVDYGSSDVFSGPVKKLINSYPFAQYYYIAHKGLLWNKSKAFNYGILKAETDFILTADVDLIFNPETIAIIEKLVDASTFTLFNYGYLPKKTTSEIEKTKSFAELKPSHFGNINGVGLYPLRALKEVRGYDEFFHFYGSEDEDLYVRLQNAGYPVKRDARTLFLHQWHPRYPGKKEMELTIQPRLNNVLRINQQHYFRSITSKKVIPFNQKDWGNCFENEDLNVLQNPTLQFMVTNIASSVVHFLNEHLPSCKGEIVAIDFIEDPKSLSLKNRIKRTLGKKEQPILTLKEINDLVLEKIIFDYRHFNYCFKISEDLKKISFTIDLKSRP